MRVKPGINPFDMTLTKKQPKNQYFPTQEAKNAVKDIKGHPNVNDSYHNNVFTLRLRRHQKIYSLHQ